MAAWQYDFWLVPFGLLTKGRTALPEHIAEDEFDSTDWWTDVNPDELHGALSACLPTGQSYTSSIELWGTYEGHRFELLQERGAYLELSGRLDLRSLDREFVRALVEVAARLNAVFLSLPHYTTVGTTAEELLRSVTASPAFRFVSDPETYLENLAHGETDPSGSGWAT